MGVVLLCRRVSSLQLETPTTHSLVEQDAGANAYVASLKDNASVKMGILHAVYGAGAFAAPLIATQFRDLPHWSFFYLVSLGIAVLNLVALVAVFRFKTQEGE